MFGAVLHWLPSNEEYDQLTITELAEFREVVVEILEAR